MVIESADCARIVAIALLLVGAPALAGPDVVFSDDFETGDTLQWSSTFGQAMCDSLPALFGDIGCSGGQSCGLADGFNLGCVDPGPIPFYGDCSSAACTAGSSCVAPSTCLPYCDSSGPLTGVCPGCGVCLGAIPTSAGTLGLCSPPDSCEVVFNTCSAGNGCVPLGCGTFCLPEGSTAPGDACQFVDECVPGYLCFGECIKACRLSMGSGDCPGGAGANAPCSDFGSGVPDLGRCSL